MSKLSSSLLAKAAAVASDEMARNVILSSSGLSPHHLSFGTSVSTFWLLSKLSTLNGPDNQSLFSVFQPLLKVSGSLTLSALARRVRRTAGVQSG